MAMTPYLLASTALSAVTIGLLAILASVWLRNYRTFGSRLVLGLVVFTAVLLVENLTAIYFFFSTAMLYAGDPSVQLAVLVLRGLQLVAVGFLTWVTLQ